MAIFQINKRRGHKFFISLLLFGFCMARIVTCITRIAWATRPNNSGLSTAAQILANAGVLLLYLTNLVFAQRILRAKQPRLGWNPVLRLLFKLAYVLLVGVLAMVITSIVLSSSTRNLQTLKACRDIQLAASTFLLGFVLLPLVVLAAAFIPKRSQFEEFFGEGDIRTKVLIVVASSCLATVIAGFKTGVAWETPRPSTNPAWYHSKACLYIFNFTLEVVILAVFLFCRVDKKFHVSDGSKAPGDYSRPNDMPSEKQ